MSHTVLSIQNKKALKEPIVALTCYDAASARLIDTIVDVALVGDSLANTRLGYPNTLPVTVEEMLHHTKAARRGIKNALLVADLPFLSYEYAPAEAARTAGRFIKEGGATAVKVEGGARIAASVAAIIKSNIPVMGHVGLTPQSIHAKGGYFVEGRSPKAAEAVLKEALLLESLGVFAIVLEGLPTALAKKITKRLKIPTIGIGAGPHCDGQILVLDDMLGLTAGPRPKFVKTYAALLGPIQKALRHYRNDVLSRSFPDDEHSYT